MMLVAMTTASGAVGLGLGSFPSAGNSSNLRPTCRPTRCVARVPAPAHLLWAQKREHDGSGMPSRLTCFAQMFPSETRSLPLAVHGALLTRAHESVDECATTLQAGLAERAAELREAGFDSGVLWVEEKAESDSHWGRDTSSWRFTSLARHKLADLRAACKILPVEAHISASNSCRPSAGVLPSTMDAIERLADTGSACVTLDVGALAGCMPHAAGAWSSAAAEVAATLRSVRWLGVPRVGLAVKPSVNPDRLLLHLRDMGELPDSVSVLMADRPQAGGFSGSYMPSMEGKLRHLAALLDGTDCTVTAVGGITTYSVSFAARAGAQAVTVLDLEEYVQGEENLLYGSRPCQSLPLRVRQDLTHRWFAARHLERYLERHIEGKL
mmetsp:Transcript_20912/g.57992  ORF Transcript_20912/g.57992 Transcript_20912/m.57992 type:complete len:383 (+) Transcript_20912:193-1341(+)